MTKKINEDFIKQLNPQAKVLFQEYNIAFENKMWASVMILSLTIIDNILNDIDNLDYVDGLDINHFKSSKDFHWLRIRRNQILHFEKPIEGFFGNKDSDKTLKLDAVRADKTLKECFNILFRK
tara:strand:- start:409 stop:777 length:369 start_codon:yes stop_codon:yes gene_type:complete